MAQDALVFLVLSCHRFKLLSIVLGILGIVLGIVEPAGGERRVAQRALGLGERGQQQRHHQRFRVLKLLGIVLGILGIILLSF